MRTTGIIRDVDKNGRIVIPKEFRKLLEVENDNDSFEIFMEEDKIILKKYQPGCVFCGEVGEALKFGDHYVCIKCITKLEKLKNSIYEL